MPRENVVNIAYRHAHDLFELPEPPETFTYKESDLSYSQLTLFRMNGLIQKESDERPIDWQVAPFAYEQAKSHVDNSDVFPCCNTTRGITNDDGTLRCINCGAKVPREMYRKLHP